MGDSQHYGPNPPKGVNHQHLYDPIKGGAAPQFNKGAVGPIQHPRPDAFGCLQYQFEKGNQHQAPVDPMGGKGNQHQGKDPIIGLSQGVQAGKGRGKAYEEGYQAGGVAGKGKGWHEGFKAGAQAVRDEQYVAAAAEAEWLAKQVKCTVCKNNWVNRLRELADPDQAA